MAQQPASAVFTLSRADRSQCHLLGKVMCDFLKYQNFYRTLFNLPLEEYLVFSLRYESFIFFFVRFHTRPIGCPPKSSGVFINDRHGGLKYLPEGSSILLGGGRPSLEVLLVSSRVTKSLRPAHTSGEIRGMHGNHYVTCLPEDSLMAVAEG